MKMVIYMFFCVFFTIRMVQVCVRGFSPGLIVQKSFVFEQFIRLLGTQFGEICCDLCECDLCIF
jgi:hypothetical protein